MIGPGLGLLYLEDEIQDDRNQGGGSDPVNELVPTKPLRTTMRAEFGAGADIAAAFPAFSHCHDLLLFHQSIYHRLDQVAGFRVKMADFVRHRIGRRRNFPSLGHHPDAGCEPSRINAARHCNVDEIDGAF